MDCQPHSMTSTTTHVALQVHRMGGSGDTNMAMMSAKEVKNKGRYFVKMTQAHKWNGI